MYTLHTPRGSRHACLRAPNIRGTRSEYWGKWEGRRTGRGGGSTGHDFLDGVGAVGVREVGLEDLGEANDQDVVRACEYIYAVLTLKANL